jgi:MFS family permease
MKLVRFWSVVSVVLLTNGISHGILNPLMPFWQINQFAGTSCEGRSTPDCNRALLDYNEASTISTTLGLILSLFCFPLFGRWSDLVGRRRFLILGTIFAYILRPLVVIIVDMKYLPLITFYISSVLIEMSPYLTVMYAACIDTSDVFSRALNLGLLFGGNALGLLIGTTISPLFSSQTVVFYISLGLSCFASLTIMAFLPETRPSRTHTKSISIVDLNPLTSVSVFGQTRHGRLVAAIVLLAFIASSGFNDIMAQYGKVRTYLMLSSRIAPS